jgi:hypothetical protein
MHRTSITFGIPLLTRGIHWHSAATTICLSQGAALTWTEMVRAQAIARNNGAALDLIDTHDAADRTPTGLQVSVQLPRFCRAHLFCRTPSRS